MKTKNILIGLLIVAVLGGGGYLLSTQISSETQQGYIKVEDKVAKEKPAPIVKPEKEIVEQKPVYQELEKPIKDPKEIDNPYSLNLKPEQDFTGSGTNIAVLYTEQHNNTSSEDLILDYPENTSVKNIIDWKLNDRSISVLNLPFEVNYEQKDFSDNDNSISLINPRFNANSGYDGHGALVLNGSNDYVQVENTAGSKYTNKNFSISVWMKTDRANSGYNGWILDTKHAGQGEGNGSQGYDLFLNDNKVSFRVGAGDINVENGDSFATVSSDKNVTDGQWHHVTAISNWDTMKISLYVDNEYQDSSDFTEGDYSTSHDLLIGKYFAADETSGEGVFFKGTIDDLNIFNLALDSEQITYLNSDNQQSRLSSALTKNGDVWQACVNDTVCSNTLTIGEQISVDDSIILYSENNYNTSKEDLIVDYPKTNSSKDILDWKLNKKSISLLNLPFELNNEKIDFSSNNYKVTANGPKFDSNSGHDRYGAFTFDGINNYMKVENTAGSNYTNSDFSISLWVKTNRRINNEYNGWILDTKNAGQGEGSDSHGYDLFLENNRVSFRMGAGDIDEINKHFATVKSGGLITDGKWHHIAAVTDWDTMKMSLYVDGKYQGSSDFTRGDYSLSQDLFIGKYYGVSANNTAENNAFFKGSIDDLNIYNLALDAEQIGYLASDRNDRLSSALTNVGDTWQTCIADKVVNKELSLKGAKDNCSNLLEIVKKAKK